MLTPNELSMLALIVQVSDLTTTTATEFMKLTDSLRLTLSKRAYPYAMALLREPREGDSIVVKDLRQWAEAMRDL